LPINNLKFAVEGQDYRIGIPSLECLVLPLRTVSYICGGAPIPYSSIIGISTLAQQLTVTDKWMSIV